LLLIALAGGAFLLRSNPSAAPSPQPPEAQLASPALLTGAVDSFEALHTLGVSAVRERSVDTLDKAFAVGGPAYERAHSAIRELASDRIFDYSQIELLSVRAAREDNDDALLRVKAVIMPCFVTEKGADVTRGPQAVTRESEWRLRRVDGEWKLYDATVLDQKRRPMPKKRICGA
jgi:hypothetical protein